MYVLTVLGLEFKRQNARNGALSVTKQKLLLRKVFDVAGQVSSPSKFLHLCCLAIRMFKLESVLICVRQPFIGV